MIRQYLVVVEVGEKVESDVMLSKDLMTELDVDQIFERCKNLNPDFKRLMIAHVADLTEVDGEIFRRSVDEEDKDYEA